ncbi:unnamed protein product, partial [Allacma fusca]
NGVCKQADCNGIAEMTLDLKYEGACEEIQ